MLPSSSSQPAQKHQSRFTANSMFQRQLSTTALNSSSVDRSAFAGQTGTTRTGGSSTSGGPSKLFQRQLTTSQLFSGSSAANCQASGSALHQDSSAASSASNKQRAAALLASARSPIVGHDSIGANTTRPSSSLVAAATDEGQQKRPAKNKRIISRMLSISAIHTGNLGLGGGGSSGVADLSNLSGSHQHLNIGNGNQFGHSDGTGDQMPDKIDSSFTRSRSSSASSGVQIEGQLPASGESIQCLCFLDWTQAASVGANNSNLNAPASGPNHKSASSIAGVSDAGQVGAGNQQLALYLGTSQGRVLLVGLEMPDNEDNRILQLQSVNAEPIPQAAIKLPGAILCLSTFASEPNRLASSSAAPSGGGAHLASQSSSLESETPQLGSGSSGSSSNHPRGQQDSSSAGSCGSDARAALFIAVVSEKQAKVYQVPSSSQSAQPSPPYSSGGGGGGKQQSGDHLHHGSGSTGSHHRANSSSSGSPLVASADSPMARLLANKANCVAKIQLSDSSTALRAQLVQMRQPDESCLAAYLATGDIVVHSLPKLSLLMEAEFVPASSPRIGQSMCFSRQGHALYQPSPKEVAKFTISAHYKTMINEMTGSLYVAREMPEMPRANFFKSLFSVTSSVVGKQSDRDELFGSEAGKASTRGVAKHIPTGGAAAAGLDKLKGAVSGGMGHEMRLAREGLDERGEKLSEIEDRTLQMMNQSETYAQTAHQLAQKFKDKKWYQF